MEGFRNFFLLITSAGALKRGSTTKKRMYGTLHECFTDLSSELSIESSLLCICLFALYLSITWGSEYQMIIRISYCPLRLKMVHIDLFLFKLKPTHHM